ncbi:phospholipid scramblase 1-like isoform X2 [Suricata suricatta]|uniref:phospholipid scramblase 1-like isoform X2 n=1 Tax=Suricata suricatta TaxID=37032 RepID=UPI0011555EAA|nr:phospholipid scramblase 1-like isoform X2 [Suricata suricatta]
MAFCNLQPTTQWMQTPETISDCPPGLEYLIQINQLLVCQRFDLLEVLGCFATSKKYEIMNNQGQRIYFAEDRSNCFLRYLCGPSRPFTMTIYDHVGRDVITIKRTLRSSCCWRNCSVQKLKVEAPPGEKIGYVYQSFHPFLPMFAIKNENKEDVMKIRGPCMVSSCLKDLNFNLLSLDEEIVLGKISKKWAGFMITNADTFGIQFPFNLDVKIKALMLGASFLIDYMYFEVWP